MLACLAVLAGVVGCAGDDLVKVTHERTTVPPQPGSGGTGPVPDGPVDEPALAPDKLRTADACKLLSGETVTQLGTPGEPIRTGPDVCRVTVTDQGGQEVRLSLTIGETLYGGTDKATGGIDGLPLTETRQDETCTERVLTAEDPDIGIGLSVNYKGGEPCGAGRKVIAKVLQQLKNDPPQVSVGSDSLIGEDPCRLMPASTLGRLLGSSPHESPYNLHGCTWSSTAGKTGTVSLTFTFAYPPLESPNSKKVRLSGSVTAVRNFYDPKRAQCQIEWEHKKFTDTGSQDGETVRVDYADYTGDEDAEFACTKALQLAKSVAAKLP